LGSAALQHVVTIEIEPEMIRESRSFYPANCRAFDDPRATFAIDDTRAYFAARGRQFDLIVSEPSNPWVSGVSGLFTTEFYGRVKGYLTPNGIFAQWLHLYEIDDGLVLGVIVALSQHFPTYSIFQISNRDILIVATTRPTLPAPDWSIFRSAGLSEDLKRVWPITAQTMETLRVADNQTLDPLVHAAGVANSDFYPTLDLNAERARFMKSAAFGFAGRGDGDGTRAARLAPTAPVGRRRRGSVARRDGRCRRLGILFVAPPLSRDNACTSARARIDRLHARARRVGLRGSVARQRPVAPRPRRAGSSGSIPTCCAMARRWRS
jgi:hypothetical protein